MKIFKILFGLLLLVSYTSQAQIYYLQYDPNCMERYNYEVGGSFTHQAPYYDYHVRISNNAKVIFRVEKLEINEELAPTLEKDPISCETTTWISNEFVNKANEKEIGVYIVEPNGNNFIIRRVQRVNRIVETNRSTTFRDGVHDFEYIYDKAYVGNNNLTLRKGTSAKVMFNARTNIACLKERRFTTYDGHSESVAEDLHFVERVGLTRVSRKGGELRLMDINGTSVANYIAKKCAEAPRRDPKEDPKTDPNPKQDDDNTSYIENRNKKKYGGTDTDVVPDQPCDNVLDPMCEDNHIVIGATGEPMYEVQSGDMLSEIAYRFRLPMNSLLCLNDKKTDKIYPGDQLYVVDRTGDCGGKVKEEPNFDSNTMYKVKDGDNLGKIADRYNLSLYTLKCINDIQGHIIKPGQYLTIVDRDGSCSQQPDGDNTPRRKAMPDENGWYTVQEGDNFYELAEQFNTTVGVLRCLNDKDNNMIYPGDRLLVLDLQGKCTRDLTNPVTKVDEQNRIIRKVHFARQGESVYKIAKKYNLKSKDIFRLNPNLNPPDDPYNPNPIIQIDQPIVVSQESY